jgi:dihydroxy-acid dehydratase
MMKAVGFTDESLARPQIGIAHCWIGTMPCNWNHRDCREGVTPRSLVTRRSFENAITGVLATGGSTNAVLHLLATASDFDIPLSIDDFDRLSRRTPMLADLRPWGTYTAPEMYAAGGMAVVGKRLLKAGLLHSQEKTVTGRSLGEGIARAREPEGQDVIRQLDRPLKKEGGIGILRGNLAPGGCVMKISGQTKRRHSGAARVFEREDAFTAIKEGCIQPNDVMVLATRARREDPGCARCNW